MRILRAMKALRLLSVLVLVTAGFAASAAERVTYYHLDALGSPVAASDEQGNLVWREDYKPYGERTKKEPAAASNSRYYTGHPHDQDTGLTYAGARYYDPVVGRFMAVDPKPFSEERSYSFNRYAYAANNPYRFRDPDGRDIEGYELQTYGGTAGAEVLTGSGQVVFQAVEYGSYVIGGISLVRAGVGLGRGLFRAGGNLVAKGLSKPSVGDSKLQNLVNDLYKGANTKKPIGTGSTADAIRHEALTGNKVGGKFHTQKGQEYSSALRNWLRRNPNASAADRQAAQSMLDDLTDALGSGK